LINANDGRSIFLNAALPEVFVFQQR